MVTASTAPVWGQDSAGRKELRRVDLSGAPGMVEVPGKPAFAIPTGAPIMNLRDAPHAGFKIVGDKTVKLITVHIVDKGKPLYDWVKK